MGQVVDLSDAVRKGTGGDSANPELIYLLKVARIAGVSTLGSLQNRLHSLWRFDGVPGSGAIPTTAAVCTRTTTGALGQANPGGGKQRWLVSMEMHSLNRGPLELYDRLAHCGGLSGTVITAQTVNVTPNRYTGAAAEGNIIFVEIYTAIGATPTTITASYTNEAGTAGRVTPAVPFGGTRWNEAARIIPLPFQAGDRGARSVESVTVLASTGTAGNFGVTIGRPYFAVNLSNAGAGGSRALGGDGGHVEVATDACVAALTGSGAGGNHILRAMVALLDA